MKSIEDILNDDVKLPSLPSIALRIINAVKTDEASLGQLSKIVSSDPALAARVLKISNSSFYALPQKIDNIQKALTILGTESLKNIALSFVIVKMMQSSDGNGFNFEIFWKRAVTAAVAADLISNATKQRSDDIFITALLQDIGIIILYLCMPEEYLKVLDEKRVSAISVVEAERNRFDYDHQAVGTQMLEKWGLPESIYLPIRYHHNTKNIPENCETKARILWLADRMSSAYHGSRCADKINDINQALGEVYGFSEEEINGIIDAVADKSVEILSYFDIDAGDMKPYSQLLLEANQELGKLNVSYEQLILELKRSKEQAESLAIELKSANEKLRELATKDGLTELYNHRFFQQAIEKEIGRAYRYKKPLSLLLLDIDHFKRVNDQYGHPAGDKVLKVISAIMLKVVRESDMVARYGGEEFAVMLPETDLSGGAILAERLRKAVEKVEIPADGEIIKTTISIGVTTYNLASKHADKAQFIRAADKGLYLSKESGRNKISIVNMSSS
jgi:diguanylate cyclase (GGDEF)-like protein